MLCVVSSGTRSNGAAGGICAWSVHGPARVRASSPLSKNRIHVICTPHIHVLRPVGAVRSLSERTFEFAPGKFVSNARRDALLNIERDHKVGP